MSLRRALLIRVGALGDTILASSVAGMLKRDFPGMEVDFLASSGLEGLFSLIPEVTAAVSVPLRRLPLALNPLLQQRVRRLNQRGYELVYLMETNPRFLPLLEAIRSEKKIALGLLDAGEEPGAWLPVPVRYQRTLSARGLAGPEIFYPRLVVNRKEEPRVSALLGDLGLDPDRPIFGLHPGNSFRARKKWKKWTSRADLRSWPEDSWVELAAGIHRNIGDAQFVLFGSAQDRAANARVETILRKKLAGIRMASSAGRTTDLPLAAALMSRFSLFVATDTGPLHMAAALHVPLVGLYGPTRFEETGPFTGEPTASTIRRRLPCQPCYGGPMQRTCRSNRCMQEIRAEEVLERVLEMAVLP